MKSAFRMGMNKMYAFGGAGSNLTACSYVQFMKNFRDYMSKNLIFF